MKRGFLLWVVLLTATWGAFAQGVGPGGAPGANLANATALQSIPVSTTIPTTNYCLVYNGTQWAPASCSASAPVTSVFTRTGAVTANSGDYTVSQVTGAAPLASPALTGTPTAPTQTPGDTSTDIATDAFVSTSFAPLASPAFTGAPTAPTASTADSSTKVATTAYVQNQAYAPIASPTFTGTPTSPAFFLTSRTAGPYANYFDDFLTTAGISSGAAIAGGTGSCAASTTFLDNTSPGNISVIGTSASSNTGWGCVTSGGIYQIFNPATAPAWMYEARVIIPVLPGTTAAAYQVGMVHTYTASPWTTGIGWSLSSANSTANDWYCRYSSTATDSTVAAVASTWTRLTIVDNGTNVLWYVNGTQVCSVAVGSMPTNALYMGFTSVPGTATSETMGVDYHVFQMQASR